NGEAAMTPTLVPNAFSNTIPNRPQKSAIDRSTGVPMPLWRRHRRWLLAGAVAVAILAAIGAFAGSLLPTPEKDASTSRSSAKAASGPPILLGVLYSRTGTMATSE